tara:strand:- start:6188 stop:6952 length:765 start_codon:yes stop_codon:yes gene_type:complete
MKNKEAIEVSKQIDAYIRGKLSTKEIDELWLLFLKNPNYYELFETELHLRNLIQKNRHAGGAIIEKRARKMRMYRWVVAAAAMVIVVLTLQFYVIESTPGLDTLALNTISYSEMAAGNVDRSDEEYVINFETEFNRATAAAYMLKKDESIEMFIELKRSVINESQRGRIEFNLAILYYNSSEFELARDSFITVTNFEELDEIYIERAWWFLANTYLKLNDQENAIEAIRMVKLLDGNNREIATRLLDTLNDRGQ